MKVYIFSAYLALSFAMGGGAICPVSAGGPVTIDSSKLESADSVDPSKAAISSVKSTDDVALPPPPEMPATAESEDIKKRNRIPSTRRDYLEMITKSNATLAKDPKNAGAYVDLAYANRNLEQYKKGVDFCNKAIALDPNIPVSYSERALGYASLGESKKALADLDKAIELDPNNSAFYSNRGWIYLHEKQYAQVIEQCTKSISIYADYSPAFYCRSRAYLRTHQYDKAIADLTEAIRLYPNQIAEYYTDRAYLFIQQEQYAKALSDLVVALRLEPSDQLASAYKSIALLKSGSHEAALAELNKAILRDPKDVSALTNRVILYRLTRNFDKSLADLNAALQIDSGDAPAYRERGLTYLSLKEKEKAASDFDVAYALNPDDTVSAGFVADKKKATIEVSGKDSNGNEISAKGKTSSDKAETERVSFLMDASLGQTPEEKATFIQLINQARNCNIADHIPEEKDFDAFLQRDLNKYFEDSLSKPVRVEFEMLRKMPTLGNSKYPLYFSWVKIYVGNVLADEGAVALEAADRKAFTVTKYLGKKAITSDAAAVAKAFPDRVAVDVLMRAGGLNNSTGGSGGGAGSGATKVRPMAVPFERVKSS